MDKAEYQAKLEELTSYVRDRDYESALSIVNEVDWRRVKSVRTLSMVADVYEANRQYDDAKRILQQTLERSPASRTVLAQLTEVSLRLGEITDAEDYYERFSELAGNDNARFLLQYKLLKAKRAPLDQQIEVLRAYREREYTEEWAYELASLYAKAGDEAQCVQECDDMILWFGEGKFVLRALELKMKYEGLTPAQRAIYQQELARDDQTITPNVTVRPETPARQTAQAEGSAEDSDDMRGKLRESFQEVFQGMRRQPPEEEPHAAKTDNTIPLDELQISDLEPERPDTTVIETAESAETIVSLPDPKPEPEEKEPVEEEEKVWTDIGLPVRKTEEEIAAEKVAQFDLDSLLRETAGTFSEEISSGDYEKTTDVRSDVLQGIPELETEDELELSQTFANAKTAFAQDAEADSAKDGEAAEVIEAEVIEEQKTDAEPAFRSTSEAHFSDADVAAEEAVSPQEIEPSERADVSDEEVDAEEPEEQTQESGVGGFFKRLFGLGGGAAAEDNAEEAADPAVEQDSETSEAEAAEEADDQGDSDGSASDQTADESVEAAADEPAADSSDFYAAAAAAGVKQFVQEPADAAEAEGKSDLKTELHPEADPESKPVSDPEAQVPAETGRQYSAFAQSIRQAVERQEAERKVRQAEEEKRRIEEERLAKEEAERQAREEAERRAQEEAERQALEEAERKAREEEARRAHEEAVRRAQEEAERQAREEAERKAAEEAERQAREEAERKAAEEAERQAREEAERKAAEEAERQAREEAERKAAEEAKRQAREEAERKAAEEAERQAREEAERKAAEEAERQAREEAERKAAEEAERQAREEAERKAVEEAERQAREEAERKAAEEAERQAREEAERKAAKEAERQAREEAELPVAESGADAEETVSPDEEAALAQAIAAFDERIQQEAVESNDVIPTEARSVFEETGEEIALEEAAAVQDAAAAEEAIETAGEVVEEAAVSAEADEVAEATESAEADEAAETTESAGDVGGDTRGEKAGVTEKTGQANKPQYNEELEVPDPEPSAKERLSHSRTLDLSKVGENTVPVSLDEIISNETPEERRIRILHNEEQLRMNDDQRRIFTYFARIPGMDHQILSAMSAVYQHADEKTSAHGNLAIMGAQGSGKSRLAQNMISAMCLDLGMEAAKIARVTGFDMNRKDPAQIVSKMSGGFLIVEECSEMTVETVEKLGQAMDFRTDRMILILEDEKASMRGFLRQNPDFSKRIEKVISIPIFTNDELITFARTYAGENGCKLDDMAVLALYTIIGNNQSYESPMTISKVKTMVDEAITQAKRSPKRSRRGRRRGKDDGLLILQEKDFETN